MDRYCVRVGGEGLAFSAAHFITFHEEECECLHGHNFQVAAEVEAPLGEASLVIDFIKLKQILETLAAQLDHRVLVPLHSRHLKLRYDATSVRLRFGAREWIFPREDCVLLPVENTTSELFARWFAARIREKLCKLSADGNGVLSAPAILRVEVEDSPGQVVRFEQDVPDWEETERNPP